MDGENPHHGHQHQSEEEEAVRDAAADVAEVGLWALPMQEEVVAVEDDGSDWPDWPDLDLNAGPQDNEAMAHAVAQDDEAMAHALHMEELMQMEDWDVRRFQFEEPRPDDVVLHMEELFGGAEGSEVVDAAPAGEAVHHPFAEGPLVFDGSAAAQANANEAAPPAGGTVPRYVPPHRRPSHQGQDAIMQELADLAAPAESLQFFDDDTQANAADNQLAAGANGNNQLGVPANVINNQHAAPARGGNGRVLTLPHASTGAGGPRAFNQTTRHGQPVEAITIRLETRGSADAVISARQTVLGDSSSKVVLAGMEEDHDNRWYESIVREAQKMEQMEEEPGLYEVSFQRQLPSSQQEPSTEGLGFHPSDFYPDEPGPSTVRVPPLADDEVPKFDCGICMETLPILDLFHGMQCEHRFCVECMATYIEGRIHAGEVPIPCPDPACREGGEDNDKLVLHPEECKKSIDFAAFSNWGDRLTESAIPPNQRAFCPNRQCGVMLEATGGKTPAKAFCPLCSHPMCATCGLDWSSDDSDDTRCVHDCAEGPNATLVKKLAQERQWKQCPRCKMLVERTYGCNVMRCRCHFVFCYACGLPTGRQTGMEEGAELCNCHNTAHAVQMHAQWHA